MNRPVVIVDPISSGVELAPTFKKHGVPAIAITLNSLDLIGYGASIRKTDFIKTFTNHPKIAETLATYNPIAVIPGSEEGVPLAEYLTNILTPHLSNDMSKSANRMHKTLMQKALEEKNIPHLKTISAINYEEVENWIRVNKLESTPLIVKPPMSAGSDKVFHISPGENWHSPFDQILNQPTKITGELSNSVTIQEQAIGIEYAVGTVSAAGQHFLTHIIKYTKSSAGGRMTVFDHVELIKFEQHKHGEMLEYAFKVLDAVGIRWGAAHIEIILTSNGPRLIEVGARMCGGPVVQFSRLSNGSSQADRLVEIYTQNKIPDKIYSFKKSVVPVFLRSHKGGTVKNIEVFDQSEKLSTFFKRFIWVKNGDNVVQTVDYLSSIGIIALAGEQSAIYADYGKIRNFEAELLIQDSPKVP